MSVTAQGPVHEAIDTKLRAAFDPERLEVYNESGNHNVAPGSESHFRVLVVSRGFAGSSRIARHRAVHRALEGELAGPIHALAIDAWTPEEWALRQKASVSPDCLGGSKK